MPSHGALPRDVTLSVVLHIDMQLQTICSVRNILPYHTMADGLKMPVLMSIVISWAEEAALLRYVTPSCVWRCNACLLATSKRELDDSTVLPSVRTMLHWCCWM